MKTSLLGLIFVAAVAAAHAQTPAGESPAPVGEVFKATQPPSLDLPLPSDIEPPPQPDSVPSPVEEPQVDAVVEEPQMDAAVEEVPPEPIPAIPRDSLMEDVNKELDKLQGGGVAEGVEPGLAEGAGASGSVSYWRVFISLCLVVALIIIVGVVGRKVGKRTPLLAGSKLGSVLGRIQLSRGASLHFVRAGGRVLVIGVTATNTSLVSEFDASAFVREGEGPSLGEDAFSGKSFAARLQDSSKSMTQDKAENVEDDEIDSLRSDIQRLQKYLREEAREHRE